MGMKKRFILSLFYNKVKHTERKASLMMTCQALLHGAYLRMG